MFSTVVETCTSNTCENNGTCTNTSIGIKCSCPSGYGGIHCENGKSSNDPVVIRYLISKVYKHMKHPHSLQQQCNHVSINGSMLSTLLCFLLKLGFNMLYYDGVLIIYLNNVALSKTQINVTKLHLYNE